jgi:Ca2+-binding EF-hand superfamily protein
MVHKAKVTGQVINDEMLDQIFLEMDTDQNGNISVEEFVDL